MSDTLGSGRRIRVLTVVDHMSRVSSAIGVETSFPARKRCRLLQGSEHHSYCASKHRYYFRLKVHLLITQKGEPVEFLLTPASISDIKAFRGLPLDLLQGAKIHAVTSKYLVLKIICFLLAVSFKAIV